MTNRLNRVAEVASPGLALIEGDAGTVPAAMGKTKPWSREWIYTK
jgi:hypothetical protein